MWAKFGKGVLNVEARGVVSSTDSWIGHESGSSGTATVTGANSRWMNSEYLYVGHKGDGTLNITQGGTVDVAKDTKVAWNPNSVGLIQLGTGGTLETGGLLSSFDNLKGTGTINTRGLVSDVELVFDSESDLTKSLPLNGDGQDITLNLTVDATGSLGAGFDDTGTLRISDGMTVASKDGYLAVKPGSTGTATITGADSKWTITDDLTVGRYGAGELNVEAGGLVVVDRQQLDRL